MENDAPPTYTRWWTLLPPLPPTSASLVGYVLHICS